MFFFEKKNQKAFALWVALCLTGGTQAAPPHSDAAANLNSATTQSELAPSLPPPPATDDLQSLLLAARTALQDGRTGEAQEALERAETRTLDRSIPKGAERLPAAAPLVTTIAQALQALAAGQTQETVRLITTALPAAAQSDIPP